MTEQPAAGSVQSQSYKCPTCDADMAFDAQRSALHCAHCDTSVAVGGEHAAQQAIVELDLEHGLASASHRGLGTESMATRCGDCGATVSFPPSVTATACDFCGSNQVLAQQSNTNLIRPGSVVPFSVDGAAAAARFRAWVAGLWFRPSDLKRRASVSEMTGVYVPYWTFDARVDSSWTAEAGYHYYVTEEYVDKNAQGEEELKTREVQHTRWEPAWGSRSDTYDDLLVCGSRGLPRDLADRLSTFDTSQLQPYDPAYLAGWKAEEYAVELNEAWGMAVGKMESKQQRRCASDVPGDTQRGLSVSNRFSDETFKHVLLPVWLSAFRYGDRVFRFLVNGQTGEVVGKAPLSAAKITLFIAALVAAGVGIYFLVTALT